MEKNENSMSPEVKKAIWKIIIYAVTVLAAAFGGNVAARNGYHFIPQESPKTEITTNV